MCECAVILVFSLGIVAGLTIACLFPRVFNMAAIDNLNAAVTRVSASSSAIIAKVNSQPNNDGAIQAAADQLNAIALAEENAVNPPPAPEPE